MNVADWRRLESALERLEHTPVDRAEDADIFVLNTCVVRQSAGNKIYGRLGSLKPLKERRPERVIGLMGCFVGTRDPAPLPLGGRHHAAVRWRRSWTRQRSTGARVEARTGGADAFLGYWVV